MTSTVRYQLTKHQDAQLDAGRPVAWQLGVARASIGRDPGDGRYLWAVRWPRVKRRVTDDQGRPAYGGHIPEGVRQGKVDRRQDALDAIEAAHKAGRP